MMAMDSRPAERKDGTIRLPDGRTLSYAEYGDPAGPPVLYFHGYPTSRLEPGLGPVEGVRLIAPDRPGYGGSDPKAGRRLLDWPQDVAALLDALRIERAAVFGMSGGGPYAAACAYALPQRVAATAIVSGMGPPGHGWEVGGSAAFVMHYGMRRLLFGLIAATVRWQIRRATPEQAALILRKRYMLSQGDVAVLESGLGLHLIHAVREGLRRGTRGAVEDALIYSSDWGFALEDIKGRVSVWHGTADRTVPVAAAQLYGARIPGCSLNLFEGDGHFDLVAREKQRIMAELVAALG